MRTEKWLIYHKKICYTLFDYYSILEWDQLYYIVTMDGKEIDRDSKPISKENFIKLCGVYIYPSDNKKLSQ